MITIEYLEEERKKLWDRIQKLELNVKNKTSDYEKEAKSASRKASEYRNRCEDSKEAAYGYLEEVRNKLIEVDSIIEGLRKNEDYSIEKKALIDETLENSTEKLSEIGELKENLVSNVSELENLFKNHPELAEEIEQLEEKVNNSEDLLTKVSSIYKNILSRKKEIDNLYYEINGYTETDEDSGEETVIEGLKDKLENIYDDLNSKLKELKSDFEDFQLEKNDIFDSFMTERNEFFNSKEQDWTERYNFVLAKINSLLPNALTAGLSYAYSSKREGEEKEQKSLITRFNWGIWGLIIVSLIPFGVSIHSLVTGIALEEVIVRIPRLVLAILPLYIPVMWVAYSANRKLNLSKRLMEEYAHKEALSKTFEGLSKQINDIEDSETSSELRLRLLYNILEVSSENPGKLISNYNKSDHPLMDALDKSVKLANAVDKLANVPGLSKLSKVIDRKAVKLNEEQSEKVGKGLDKLDKVKAN
ncbi:MAG: hypothetical protein MI739_01565 [Bacteroidales bacterium]|nr:hypothetical protein [Bacteroidales bacterium]